MAFHLEATTIKDLVLIRPDVFGDERGFFMESHNQGAFKEIGLDLSFYQDNLSFSSKGILRGLHFQREPFEQGKLVSVIDGEVLDVAVDIRKSSPTYGQHFSVVLSGKNHLMMYVPPGFAHGFTVLSDTCYFHYKCTGPYNQPAEGGLMWNDPDLNIDWGVKNPVLSEKDKYYAPFSQFDSPFT